MQIQQHRMYREDEEERYEGSRGGRQSTSPSFTQKINELSIGLEELKGKKTIFVNVCNFAEKEKNVKFKLESDTR